MGSHYTSLRRRRNEKIYFSFPNVQGISIFPVSEFFLFVTIIIIIIISAVLYYYYLLRGGTLRENERTAAVVSWPTEMARGVDKKKKKTVFRRFFRSTLKSVLEDFTGGFRVEIPSAGKAAPPYYVTDNDKSTELLNQLFVRCEERM